MEIDLYVMFYNNYNLPSTTCMHDIFSNNNIHAINTHISKLFVSKTKKIADNGKIINDL
jgi:hypothetical protein